MDMRTKNRLLSASRELTFSVGAGGGALLGFLSALHDTRQPHPSPTCKTADCVAHAVTNSMWDVVGPVLIGALVGTAIAAFLCMTVLRPVKSRPTGTTPATTTRSGPTAPTDGRWIPARFAGTCRGCGGRIVPGERIVHSRKWRKAWCESCGQGFA